MENQIPHNLKRWHKVLQLPLTFGLALFFVAALLWILSGVTPALADPSDLYVDGASGGDTATCGSVGAPCQTISYTLNIRATEGDTIHIASGTYTENLVIDSVTVTLRGGYTASSGNWLPDTGETIVDGNNVDRTFVISGTNSVLENLTITGGQAPGYSCWGGGVWATNGNVTIRSSTITGNKADCGGAGIEVDNDFGDAHLTLESSTVSHNKGNQYGGLNIFGNSTTAEIHDTIFYSNTAEYGGGFAIMWGASAVISDTQILSNTAFRGGGVYLDTDAPTLVMTDTLIQGNITTSDGAGLYARDFAQVTMLSVEVAKNEILSSSTFGQGGGLYFRAGSQAELTSMQIHDNTAAEGGGGLFLDDDPTTVSISDSWIADNTARGNIGTGGGGLGSHQGTLTITNCTVERNTSTQGGGLFSWDGGSIDLFDSKIKDNTAEDHGGAIHAENGPVNLTNALITGNQSTSGNANVLAINESAVTMMNSTISDNNPGGAQGILLWDGALTITNSILWNNALNIQNEITPACPDCVAVNYTDIEGGWTGTNNKNEDPLFLGGGNYHLGIGSPCIDEGTPTGAPTHDLEGTPRDTLPDMGAYEFELYALTVSLAGSGSGSVSSSPAGIDCGEDCTESYASGSVVTLTATPNTVSAFEGWSGACSGMGDCTVTMTEAKAVTATFHTEMIYLPLVLR